MKCFSLILAVCIASPLLTHAATINVPADQPTIQAGINAAVNGDTVLVAPGTYTENINFNGKAITVTSSGGAKVTIIDGGNVAPVATFATSEGLTSVLNGFTLQNGTSTFNSSYEGGGIYISGTSPTVTKNIIQNNTACSGGGGIAINFGSPRIQGNNIRNNTQAGCSGGVGGGGIEVGGAASAQIIGNTISGNSWTSGNGGGISLFAAGTPTIINNIIFGNSASGVSPAAQGGGISMVNDSDAIVVQNLIYGNSADQGAGIFFLVPSGSTGPTLVNNTIANNKITQQGSAVYASGFDNLTVFFNNLLIGTPGQSAVYCDGTYSSQPPTFTTNDAYSANGSGLQGTCAGQGTLNGNISADPLFVGKTNFRLQTGSPAIATGTVSAPDLPKKDIAGKPRTESGTVDMGAYESQ